jgi:hypothetical protein
MTDFWENVNESIEDNAGLYATFGGLAALKGQQAQREKLSAIEAQLQKAENRVEKEAQLKRKLIALEDFFEDLEKTLKDQKSHFLIAAQNNFNFTLFRDQVGGASDQLSSIEDIKYAKSIEKKAEKLDNILRPNCVFFKHEGLIDLLVDTFYDRVEDKLKKSAIDYALENFEINPFSSIIKEWGNEVLLEMAAQIASKKCISLEPHINNTNVSEVFSTLVFGQRERDFISALKNKKVAKIDLPCRLTFERVIYSPNSLNRRGVLAKEIKALCRPYYSSKELKEALEESIYFSYLTREMGLAIEEREERERTNRNQRIFIYFIIAVIGLLLLLNV